MPKLLLLPNLLSEEQPLGALPAYISEKIFPLQGLLAESEKEGRRYLKHFSFSEGRTFREIPILLLNEHTTKAEMQERLEPILQGQIWGIVSDAGLPCIADPGARFVRLVKQKGVAVEALSGPSSIVQALMLSGLSAQKFFFHGYLPREVDPLRFEILKLEKEAKEKGCTQVCIERPYRSMALFTAFLQNLQESTILSVAVHLGSNEEQSYTMSIRQWRRKEPLDLHKKPVVFLWAVSD